MPGFFQEWRQERQLRKRAARYARALHGEPDESDARWLAATATNGDVDRATWELRYARRALGLLVAQRDALDDRTGSAVAHEVVSALAADRNVAAGMARIAERQFNIRLRGYGDAIGFRGSAALGTRLARALFLAAGVTRPVADPDVERAAAILERYVAEANEWLREAFGVASLPEHVPPSSLQAGDRR